MPFHNNVDISLPPSGVQAVQSEALVLNTRSTAIAPKAGRSAYAWLSGTGTASGFFIFSKDGGTNWFPLYVEGSLFATFTYAKPATLGSQAFTGQMIQIPVPDQTGLVIALVPSAVSGTVNVELTA